MRATPPTRLRTASELSVPGKWKSVLFCHHVIKAKTNQIEQHTEEKKSIAPIILICMQKFLYCSQAQYRNRGRRNAIAPILRRRPSGCEQPIGCRTFGKVISMIMVSLSKYLHRDSPRYTTLILSSSRLSGSTETLEQSV